MAARSLASLTVAFGVVAIPGELYSATQALQAFVNRHQWVRSRLDSGTCAREGVVVDAPTAWSGATV